MAGAVAVTRALPDSRLKALPRLLIDACRSAFTRE
jgi:hypothetical protein